MENWKKALNKFTKNIKKNNDIIWMLVCWSYITWNPSKHSDIDIHLILSEKVNYRKRWNEIIDWFLIEYFMNPSKQISKYFKEDYKNNKTASMVQFITWKIIFDKTWDVKNLKKEAKEIFKKKFKHQNKISIEIKKYFLWDMLDNLKDSYEQWNKDFTFNYHIALKDIFETYLKFLKLPITNYYKIYSYFTNEYSRKKYLQQNFNDIFFKELFINAITEKEKSKMIECYENLTNHVLEKMWWFEINWWNIKTPLDI